MTETQPIAIVTSAGRRIKALRNTTRVLRVVGDHITFVANAVAVVAVAAWVANDLIRFAPVLDRVTAGVGIVLLLALWGAVQLIKNCACDVADWIDPDARDGDDLFDVAELLQGNADDLREGADYDDVRVGLQTSKVLPALYALTTALRNEYANDGEMDEASSLSDTAALVRAAAESLGHRDWDSQDA